MSGKLANGALRGVLYFQNGSPVCTKLRNAQRRYVLSCYVECHRNWEMWKERIELIETRILSTILLGDLLYRILPISVREYGKCG